MKSLLLLVFETTFNNQLSNTPEIAQIEMQEEEYGLEGERKIHILDSISSESDKRFFCWTNKMDTVFKCKKAPMALDCLLAYPNHSKSFHIYTDFPAKMINQLHLCHVY